MYIPQLPLKRLKSVVKPGKVTIIYGPRRIGKTTMLKKFLEVKKDYLFVAGDDIFIQEQLSSTSIEKLKHFIGDNKLLVIDEAQEIEGIGQNLKLIVDHLPDVTVIATGSSTFDLSRHLGEPLTGRKYVIKMFPISQMELNEIQNQAEVEANLENRLIYGSYPEVITLAAEKECREYLHELVSSYLFKDILIHDGVRKSKKLLDLLTLIAFQIGKEVSLSELAVQLSINKITVEKYLDLLEQVFVIINVRGFSRNLRKEIVKTSRFYFFDNGIRNALLNNFNPLSRRNDVGALWENYLVIERLKKQEYQGILSNNYFWRTYDRKELDWVEEREGLLFGYEFKWGEIKAAPKLWFESYPEATYECINKANYLPFIT